MTLNYDQLWKLLASRGMSRTEMRLKTGISSVSLAKMGKGEAVGPRVIEKICAALGCEPGRIVRYEKSARLSVAQGTGNGNQGTEIGVK